MATEPKRTELKVKNFTFYDFSDEEKGGVCPGGDRERRPQSADLDLIYLDGTV